MTLREHQGWVVNVHSQRGVNGKIISASVNGDVRFWDARNPESVLQIPTDTNLQAFEVHPMAAVFACGSMQQVGISYFLWFFFVPDEQFSSVDYEVDLIRSLSV